jgi:energy-coupling factor transporter transmembrane protein EcfT
MLQPLFARPAVASGPLLHLHPAARLLCGALVFLAILVTPAALGLPGLVLLPVVFLFMTGIPRRQAVRLLLSALFFYLPFLVITIAAEAAGNQSASYSGDLLVAGRGIAGVLVIGGALSTLTLADLHVALVGLRFSSWMALLAVHIFHQTEALTGETRRIVQAITVRNGGGSTLRVLRSLPLVWLPRVLFKADRVSMAMDVRGYDHAWVTEVRPWRRVDYLGVAAALGLVAATILLRIAGIR